MGWFLLLLLRGFGTRLIQPVTPPPPARAEEVIRNQRGGRGLGIPLQQEAQRPSIHARGGAPCMKQKKLLPSASRKASIMMHVGKTKDPRPRLEDGLCRPKTVTARKKDTIRPTITGSPIMNRGTRHSHDLGNENFEDLPRRAFALNGKVPVLSSSQILYRVEPTPGESSQLSSAMGAWPPSEKSLR